MGRIKKYFDEYEEYRLYQEIYGDDEHDDEEYVSYVEPSQSYKKEKKKPLTPEELEANGKFLRVFFTILGIIFSITVLWNNLFWLYFNPMHVSWIGIFLSIVILYIIIKKFKN